MTDPRQPPTATRHRPTASRHRRRSALGGLPPAALTAAAAAILLGCTAAAPWRAKPPPRPPAPQAADRIPEVAARATPGGVTVLVAARAHAPLVSVHLAFLAGHREDPKGKAGLARIAYHVLAEQALEAAAEAGDDEGAELAFGMSELPEVVVDADGARIGATVLPEDVDRLLARLAHAIAHPEVTEAAVDRARRGRSAVTTGHTGRPLVGEATVARVILGPDDDLSRPAAGTARSRAAVTVQDVEAFIETHLRPDAVAVVLAGPVGADAVASQVSARFDGWAAARAATLAELAVETLPAAVSVPTFGDGLDGVAEVRRTSEPVLAPEPRRGSPLLTALGMGAPRTAAAPLPVVRVAASGAPRIVVALGSPAPPSDAAGEAALRMAEQALGGALRWHLREDARLSYRVSHRLSLHRHGGLLAASASVAPDAATSATAAARRALATAPGWLEGEAGIESVRRAALHALLDELDTIANLGAATARLYQRGLPPDHYRAVARALETAPPVRASEALTRLLDPSVARIVVIGGR
jgi:zinc protease